MTQITNLRACTKGDKEVKITSWGDSFNDGLAFCALIHKHAPEELDYPGLDKGAKLTNLKKAFDVAEAIWSVPQLLAPAALAGEQPPAAGQHAAGQGQRAAQVAQGRAGQHR